MFFDQYSSNNLMLWYDGAYHLPSYPPIHLINSIYSLKDNYLVKQITFWAAGYTFHNIMLSLHYKYVGYCVGWTTHMNIKLASCFRSPTFNNIQIRFLFFHFILTWFYTTYFRLHRLQEHNHRLFSKTTHHTVI